MAKKKEQTAAVPGSTEELQETVTPGTAEAPEKTEAPQETTAQGTAEEPQETVTPGTAEAPEKTEAPQETTAQGTAEEPQEAESKTRDISEIMSDRVETVEENTGQEETPASPGTEREGQPEEKVLFYVRTVNARTAIRSAPEYPMRGYNIVGTIDDRELYGIVEVVDGFGRLAGGSGWIMLDPSVVSRQG